MQKTKDFRLMTSGVLFLAAVAVMALPGSVLVGQVLEYGTFLGGSSNEIASRGGLAVDGNIAYVASSTGSTNFAGCSGEVTNGIFVVQLDATPDSDPNDLRVWFRCAAPWVGDC